MLDLNSPLRVLHIISGDLWAGAEAQACALLKHLHPQTILHVVLMNNGELASRLNDLNIQTTIFDETKLNSFDILIHLTRLIRSFKPDIVHTHRQKENILGGLANFFAFPQLKNRPKSIRTVHGAPEFSPNKKQRLQAWLDHLIGTYLQQAVIAVSEELSQKLKKVFPPSHVHVVHNGVDCSDLSARAKKAEFKEMQPHHKHIGIIGRLEPVKRIDIFLEMARILLTDKANPPLLFHIIGEGSLRSVMEKKAIELGIAEYVNFHGHRTDIASCIYSLDIIVMCSDHEGTPMTALEALALGTLLIAHNVGGLHELLHTQKELLVSEHNPINYSMAVSKFLTINSSKPRLDARYTADCNAQNILNIYNNLVVKADE